MILQNYTILYSILSSVTFNVSCSNFFKMFGHFRRLEIKCKFTVLEENHRNVCDNRKRRKHASQEAAVYSTCIFVTHVQYRVRTIN
jgi:hypothetical protein